MNRKILVVVAHPDDEVLGMGGTMMKLAHDGEDLHIAFLSKGEGSRGKEIANEQLRIKQAEKVANIIKAKLYWLANFPDNEFDTISLLRVTKVVEAIINKIHPDVIYTHHHGDLNIDHRVTFQAVVTACRPGKTSVKQIYSFEVLSSTEWQAKTEGRIFLPNFYVDIENYIKDKISLMNIYSREIGTFPFSRSETGIRSLAQYRGMECGLNFAEAFCLVRGVYSQKLPR